MFGTKDSFFHHSFIVRSLLDIDIVKRSVYEVASQEEITFTLFDEDKLTIDFVRGVQEGLYRKNRTQYSVYIICSASMTPEAQNGLLKAIEEPPVGTIFIFSTTEPHILPTFLSRSHEVVMNNRTDILFEPKEFLKKSIEARLGEVEDILKRHKKGKIARQEVLFTVGALSEYLHKTGRTEDALRVFRMNETLDISSGSLKQVLEGVAVMI